MIDFKNPPPPPPGYMWVFDETGEAMLAPDEDCFDPWLDASFFDNDE